MRTLPARILVVLAGALALGIFLVSTGGCETTEGAGEDIENLGEEISDAAD